MDFTSGVVVKATEKAPDSDVNGRPDFWAIIGVLLLISTPMASNRNFIL